jgi:hypothetical protein
MKRVISVVLLMLLLGTMAFAEGGLTLESSNIENGQIDVSLQPQFVLDFSNNVVNIKVKDNNMTMFEMTDDDANQVPLIVEMGDDQVNREIRNTINVRTETTLEEGTAYTLKIMKDLQSKNSNTLGENLTISFTAEGEKKVEEGVKSPSYTTVIMVMLGALIGYYLRKRRK